MTDINSAAKAPEDPPLARFAVSEKNAAPKTLLATLTAAKKPDGGLSFQCQASSQEAITRLTPLIKQFQALAADAPSEPPNWQALIDLFAEDGLLVEAIPFGDAQIDIHIDLLSGKIVASQRALHQYAQNNEEVSRNVVAALSHSLPQACDDLADQIATALDNDDLQGASHALAGGLQAVFMAGTPKLLAALERLDVSKLTGDDRKRLLDCRFTTAQRLQRYDVASRDAEALLHHEGASLSEQLKATLNMAIALGALQRGNRESGIAQLRNLLKDPVQLEPEQRAWAWRNLSLALDGPSPEARRAAKRSADAFLEAGQKQEAGKSLLALVDLLIHEDIDAAVSTLDGIIQLLNKEGLENRPVYASALHARARRLLELGQPDAAYEDAKAAVELHRGLLGTEEQMVSSLHLAALAARNVGDDDGASQLEAEAVSLTDKHSLAYFKLAARLSALGDNFDAAAADALLKDAETAENHDVAISVQIHRANLDPSLKDHERLALLEDALRDFRDRARPDIINMVRVSIAVRLRIMKVFDRAADWFQEAVQNDPLDLGMRDTLIDCLWKSEQWGRAAQIIRKELDLRGDLPGLLYAHAKSLFAAGNIDGALTAAQRSSRLTTDDMADLRTAAMELRDQALDLGGKMLQTAPPPSTADVSREEFEDALGEFGQFIAGKKRMTFWKKDGGGQRTWTASPEGHAQNLLHTYLQAKFDDRIDVFEELDTGAGRLDLYVKLKGGLAVVLELKMCGGRYSSNYAASGETQIDHYMDNRKTNIGYLVVFDARITMHAKPLLSASPRHTIVELFVDVRPEVV